ncbi:LysR family transcriptional regulator, partial [Kitasatospora sp. DSM 101779]|uniref:helix-turn-helix domain-containing protein n=1 Tax=Kitasatospora sp. DSM 101779 TaxID=2853165 RepID=UPI0021DB58B3
MDIDTRLLRAFAAVFDEGQLTAAASRLGVAQPTLTKRIRLLEEQLEVRLFERSRTGMAPTAAAHQLAARVPALLAGWADALAAA